MADGPTDPRWPTILSLSAHELRSPLSVVAGYIRMLLKDRAGPVSDQQRRLLEEAEKSCGRLSTLLTEISELSQLESGTAPVNRTTVNLHSVLADSIGGLPELPDRTVTIGLTADDAITVHGDVVRLRTAFSSVLHALRREMVTSDHLVVRVDAREDDRQPSLRITIGEPTRIDWLLQLEPAGMAPFDEWRGGSGLSLPNARRIVEAHGGRLYSPAEDGKSSAIVILPGRERDG
jgi:two-component system, cell cycle sensor histidine kinase PleC